MRSNHHLQRNKFEGFIVRRSEQKQEKELPRTLSLERPLPSHTTIVSNDSIKIPGEIKKGVLSRSRKVDEEVYYNADVYTSRVKKEETVAYTEECENVLPVIREKREVQVSPVTNNSRINSSLQSIEEQRIPDRITNIHGPFDLQRYHELYSTLKSLISALNMGLLQLTQTLERYMTQISSSNLDDFSEMKLVYTKKQLLKQSFIRQREAVLIMCLVVCLGRVQKTKKQCSNLIKYAFQNYLVSLNMLAENGEFVQKLMRQSGKEHLLEKKFQFLRSTNEVINDFIGKIIKVDPLYGEQFYKIRQQYCNASVRSFLFGHLSFFSFYLHAIKAETILPFLALPPAPYLQQASPKQYTLIIDFMRVFLNPASIKKKNYRDNMIPIRPYSTYFLRQMSKYYEIVSFSDAMPIECSKLINRIDQYQVIKSKLYRYHIDRTKKKKQMNRIGRDLDKLILIDSVEDPDNKNLIVVDSWKGDLSNAQLAEICPMLAMIAVKGVSTRQAVRKIRQNYLANSHLGLKYINCGINL